MPKQQISTASSKQYALCTLSSWLDATNIKHEVIDNKIYIGDCIFELSPKDINDVVSHNQSKSFAVFHRMTIQTGHGQPIPVNRGTKPDKKMFFEHEPDLIMMRHCEFRDAPNLDARTLKQYEPIIKSCCNRFFAQYAKRLQSMGYGAAADLYSFGYIYAHNFHARYRIIGISQDVVQRNKKLMYSHIHQRLIELYHNLSRYDKLCRPTDREIQEFNHYLNEDTETPDKEWKKRHVELDLDNPTRRRKTAKEILNKNLSSLSHNDFVNCLQSVIDSPNTCYSSKREANRRLKSHIQDCKLCLKVNEDMSTVYAGGVIK